MSDLIARALAFATKAHEGQTRKYTGEPYINHPKAVSDMLRKHGLSKDVQAAAILHDVVEDCGVLLETIRAEFGPRVARLVEEVTDVSKPEDGPRETRKAIDRAHYAKASADGKSIKLADLIDNTKSIVARDPHFARTYLEEKRRLLPLLKGGNPKLWETAFRLANEDR